CFRYRQETARYHLGLGMNLRNGWGLWSGSRLAKYFNGMGLFHPDDMSGVILDSYWRRKNGKPLDVEDQVAKYKEFWENSKKREKIEEERVKSAKAEIRKRMMNLQLVDAGCPTIELKDRKQDGIRIRYAAKLDDSIFVTLKYIPPPKDKSVPFSL